MAAYPVWDIVKVQILLKRIKDLTKLLIQDEA